jgi:hypothetical protein
MSGDNLDDEFRKLFVSLADQVAPLLSPDEKRHAIINPDETRRSVERAIRLQKKSSVVHPNLKS